MDNHGRHDAFSLKFYNQGLSPPTTTEARRVPSNASCPYHAAVLGLRLQQIGSQSTIFSRQMLQNVPPSGLTQDWCIGSSANMGCTCASARGAGRDNMAREIEAIMRASEAAATATPSGQS
jgi:hypothetical protein